MDRVLTDVAALPGVTDTAASASLPPNAARLRFTMNRIDEAVGQPTNYLVDAVVVTPRFFTTLRVPLVKGRVFTDADADQQPPVMMMSVDTARALFGDGDPIGKTLSLPSLGKKEPDTVTLVGLIGNIKYSGLDAAPNGAIYRPYAQQPFSSMFVLARTAQDQAGLPETIARTIGRIDPAITILSTGTVEDMVLDAAAQPRFRALVLAALAAIALAVAGVGLYGVISYSVSRRTAEIAVRMALGASAGQVERMVLREGLALSIAGIAVGTATALGLSGLVRSLLFGVAPTDPWSFAAAGLALLFIATAACYLPAHRASAVDPIAALRAE